MDLKDQMGILGRNAYDEIYQPNSTKCMEWRNVKVSHENDTPQVVVSFDDILGMILLLSIGLSGAVIALYVECLSNLFVQRSMKRSIGAV